MVRGACHYHTDDPGNIYPWDENVWMWSFRELPGILLVDQGLVTLLVYLIWSIPFQAFCRDENPWDYTSPLEIPQSKIQCWIHHCASRRRFCGLAFALRKLLPLNCRVRVTLLLFMWGEYTLNVFPKMSNVFQNVAYFVWFFLLSVKFSKGHRPRFMTPPRLMNPILDVL